MYRSARPAGGRETAVTSSSARKVIALNRARNLPLIGPPLGGEKRGGGSTGTVGVRIIAFEEAIIFLKSKVFLPADRTATDEKESC